MLDQDGAAGLVVHEVLVRACWDEIEVQHWAIAL